MQAFQRQDSGSTILQLVLILAVICVAALVSIIAIHTARIEAQDQIAAAQSELQVGQVFAANQSEIIDAQARVIAALMKAEATERVDEKRTAIAEATAGMEEVQKVYRRLGISTASMQELSK